MRFFALNATAASLCKYTRDERRFTRFCRLETVVFVAATSERAANASALFASATFAHYKVEHER